MFINWSPIRKLIWLKASGAIVPDLPWKTITGNPLSFIARTAHALKSCVVGIEPVQSGSGDPSPDNVRPISGFTGANVTRAGVNVWDEEWINASISTDTGNVVPGGSNVVSKNYIIVSPNVTFYTTVRLRFFFYNESKEFLSFVDKNAGSTFTTPSNCYYMLFTAFLAYGSTYNHDISINYPSTDHDYHASNVFTIPISWQSEAGTVYGGTLDVTTGVLTVDRAILILRSNVTRYATQALGNGYERIYYRFSVLGIQQPAKGGLFSHGVYLENYTQESGHFYTSSTDFIVFLPTESQTAAYLDAQEQAGHPVQICYPLATPQTYQLTAQQVSAIVGENNMWTDCATLTVEAKAMD